MQVTIAFIGTEKYWSFFQNFYYGCYANLLLECDKKFLVFTNALVDKGQSDVSFYHIPHEPWPLITLKRFETLLKAEKEIIGSDYFLFLDADMLVVSRVKFSDLFNELPFTGVAHPAFYRSCKGTFESNPKSMAFVSEDSDRSIYWQGCLWGGRSAYIVGMLRTLSSRVNKDLANGIVAKWHDESHLNRFFIDSKSLVNTLDPSFAYPEIYLEAPFEKKILHLKKRDQEYGNLGPS